MNIYLSDKDIALMPEPLRNSFLNWVLNTDNSISHSASILSLDKKASDQQLILNLQNQAIEEKEDNSRVRLTQLFDAGISKQGMPVRVRLKRKIAKKLGREYINNLEISAKGTIIYNGEEFDQPSPLSQMINQSASNGWKYIEVKKDDKWFFLDELRQIWRNTND